MDWGHIFSVLGASIPEKYSFNNLEEMLNDWGRNPSDRTSGVRRTVTLVRGNFKGTDNSCATD
jgi:hypothetical protein